MKDLLKHELFKLKRNKAFYIVLAITLFIGFMVANVVARAYQFAGSGAAVSASRSLIIVATCNEILFTLCAVMVASLIVTEFQRGVIRNMVMSGHSRFKIYLTKYIATLLAGTILLVTIVILSIVATFFANGWGPLSFGKFILMFLHMWLQYAAVISITLFFATITRSTAATICINIGLLLLFSFIGSLALTSTATDASAQRVAKVVEFIGDLYPGILAQKATIISLTTQKVVQYVCTAVLLILASFVGGAILFERSDIK